jgi:hypothetical protein
VKQAAIDVKAAIKAWAASMETRTAPENSVTIKEYAEMCKKSPTWAQKRLSDLAAAGLWESCLVKRKLYYWPVSMPGKRKGG